MKKYSVDVKEIITYTVEVEANSIEDAETKAQNMVIEDGLFGDDYEWEMNAKEIEE